MKQETTDEMIRLRSEYLELRKKFIKSPDYCQQEQDAAMDIIYLIDDYLGLFEGVN